jgi:hypothetical protein
MTTEEFHGHMMALLHGPHAAEVVSRMLDVAITDEAIAGRIGTLLGETIDPGPEIEQVIELEMLAHLNAIDPFKPRSPQSITNAVVIGQAKERAIGRIRDRLRAQMRKSDAGRTVAASILLDLGEDPS